MPATLVNPTEYKGYPVELLRGLKGMGPALVGDPALYRVATEYNGTSVDGGAAGILGPALLTSDCHEVVQSVTARALPDTIAAPVAQPETAADPSWDDHDLESLMALCAKHGVEVKGRVQTPGKLIAALEAASIGPNGVKAS